MRGFQRIFKVALKNGSLPYVRNDSWGLSLRRNIATEAIHFLFMINILGLTTLLLPSLAWASSPQPWQMYYQKPVTSIMEQLYDFHWMLLIIEGLIVLLVGVLLIYVIVRFRASQEKMPSKVAHNTLLEVIWTLIPLLILVVIAFPSFKILYTMDVTPKCPLTIKAIGNQWYWTYEYPDYNIRFDSNMVPENKLQPDQLRLLEVDNRVIIPTHTNVRVITTSSDVIHSWTIPAFGIKRDSIPGRLNEIWFNVKKEGIYYGQCSELCGVKHGYMPIVVEAVPPAQFEKWIISKKDVPQTHKGG